MRILEVHPQSEFKLYLRFDDGLSGEVDLSDFAGRGVFTSWLESGVFDQVQVTEVGAVAWPGGIDLCPDALYMRLTGKSPEEILPTLRKVSTDA